jgi:AcrR family transcriptional regulator
MDKTERRLDILRAARQCFATRGYHDTKVDDIVAVAKVAKGTFYLYFRDKRSIFVELVDTLFTRLGGAILRVDTEADVARQVRHNIRAILAVLLDDPETTQILMSHAAGLDSDFSAKIQSFYDGVKSLLRESLEDGQRLGIVSDGDAGLFATFSIGALKEVLLEMTSGAKPRSREKVVDELFRLLENGYLRIDPTKPVKPWRPEDSSSADTPFTVRTLEKFEKPARVRTVKRLAPAAKRRR